MEKQVYGWYNGTFYYSKDEFRYAVRKRGPINTDEELIAFAEKVTHNWYNAGWHHTFTTYYLSDYALSEPRTSLTDREFKRLVQLQQAAQTAEKAADEARCWHNIETNYYADNSVEEVWEDKDGNRKTIMTVAPHGDVCF